VPIGARPRLPEYNTDRIPDDRRTPRRNCRSNYFVASHRTPQHLGISVATIPALRCESKWIDRPFVSINHTQSPAPHASVAAPTAGQRYQPRHAHLEVDPRAELVGTDRNAAGPVLNANAWSARVDTTHPGGRNVVPTFPGPDDSREYTRSQRHFSANRTAAVRTDPDVGIVHAVQLADRRRRAAFRQ
jgi:hypothetical protein